MSIKDKLKSRKLWAAVVGVITGLAMVFGLDEHVVNTVAGAVVALGSLVTYIVTEGRIDAAAVDPVIQAVQDAANVISFAVPSEEEENE